jgi:hypothetical protein
VCLILGDNIFYGHGFYPILEECTNLQKGGIIFGYQVTDPHRYGIVAFDDNRNVLSIEEVTFRKGLITAQMPTILQILGWRLFFYANESQEPMHIHCTKNYLPAF